MEQYGHIFTLHAIEFKTCHNGSFTVSRDVAWKLEKFTVVRPCNVERGLPHGYKGFSYQLICPMRSQYSSVEADRSRFREAQIKITAVQNNGFHVAPCLYSMKPLHFGHIYVQFSEHKALCFVVCLLPSRKIRLKRKKKALNISSVVCSSHFFHFIICLLWFPSYMHADYTYLFSGRLSSL